MYIQPQKMKKMSRRKITIRITIVAFFCVSIFVVAKQTKANQPTSGIENGVSELQDELWYYTVINNKDLLKTFCIAAEETIDWFSDGNLLYTANYSLFLWVLCRPFKIDVFLSNSYGKKLGDKYLAEEVKKDWIILWIDPEHCDPETDMETCDIENLIKTIFSAVMNDQSFLAVWAWAMSSDKTEELIKEFSETYFGGGDTICDGKSFYLDQKSVAGAEACSHPKTYKYLNDIIDWFKKGKQTLKTINKNNIAQIDKDAESCENWSNTFANLFLCSYTSRPLDNKQALQTNLWYNDLMYYRLLSKWLIVKYESDTVWFWTINLVDTNNSESKNIADQHKNKILFLENEIEKSKRALTIMQKAVVNFQSTFPLHVGLLAYYEDILWIKKSFVKIYTPLHQLYYTLRNVQSKQ